MVNVMINICFAGVTGWTAPPIIAAIDEADDLTLTAGVSRSAAGQVMRHDPGLTPAPYVAGTLLAVRNVADAVGVRRGLDSLLFDGPA